ncbi:hypothetical protein HII17_14200 [Thalassotalea sp. M1531]|uniref:DUF2189 domain-containing protein n=1 Tax=Thalassotalea algicola TaxID=2716224 RepID=A0A7Y0LGE9_9GAMM|nr:hypothetical protein [Thalassotalea algicola]NMP32710.1 hypothetical protein [Thalassotalea algicola]
MHNDIKTQSIKRRVVSYGLLFIATFLIFAIAEGIRTLLDSYDLNAMFISFCAGFILFVPLVSLVLHPIILVDPENNKLRCKSTLMANIGLVFVVQVLFFLIWMTDAIALYSMYVDNSSFLAKAFNVSSESNSDLSVEFFWFNLLLAWLFALLSISIGLLPCLIARIKNRGTVGNFVASIGYAKANKLLFSCYSLIIALSVVIPLLYAKYLFLLAFPIALSLLIVAIGRGYLNSQRD